MKKYLLVFLLVFTFFIFPKPTLAEGNNYQYQDHFHSNTEINEAIERAKNTDVGKAYINKNYFIAYVKRSQIVNTSVSENFTEGYVIGQSDNIAPSNYYFNIYGYFVFFDSEFNVIDNTHFSGGSDYLRLSPFIDENNFSFPFIYASVLKDGYLSKSFNLYNGEELLYSYNAYKSYHWLDLRKDVNYFPPKEPDKPVFENNTIYELSLKILGTDIPEEFNWCYLVVGYLIAIIFVIILVLPFVVIVKIVRW